MDSSEATSVTSSLINVETFITLTICALSFYYFYCKKKSNDLDVKSIKSFSIESSLNRNTASNDTNFVDKMIATGRKTVVFYGSQTGTAEEFSARLAKDSIRYGLKALVADLEECDMDDLVKLSTIPNSLALFCLATYGEGDPTDNAIEFNEWLQQSSTDLSGVKYAVFGLGNKTYEHFNSFGKYVDKRLAELGAERVVELGLGDDDSNIEEDFITWKEVLWSAVCESYNIEMSGEDVSLRQYELVVHEDLAEDRIFTGEVARLNSFRKQKPPFDAKNPYLSPVIENRELYKGERSCMHIELDIKGSKIRYEAGDHVAVQPQNDPKLVEKIGQLLNVNLDTVFTLKNTDEDSSKKHPFPCPCSYRTALTYYIDITQTPRTHVLKELSDYASDEEHKKLLKTMSSPTEEGKALYSEWIIKNCRSVVHVLEDLPSVKIAIDHLLELLPRLQVRYYSISSSPKLFPDTIHITAVLIDYTNMTGRHVRGVATGFLKNKIPSNNGNKPVVPIFVRRSQFKLPAKPQTPIIMIGPGTGFAPFRGFIQERQWMMEQEKPIGDAILYFGCRKRSEDFLYEEEIKGYLEKGAITKLYTAFSREQEKKVYVTHILLQNRKELWDVIGVRNGHLYICGDARTMAKDVREILLQVIQEEGSKTREEAEAYLKKMETQRRYSADVWS